MKSFADAIEAAEKVGKKKEKFAALSGIKPNQQRLIVEALNPYRVFNVKKWNDTTKRAAKTDASIDKFYWLLDQLHDRKITGDMARAAVSDVLSWYTKETAKYLARVIKKDLKCGADKKTFLKIYPNLKIPSFKVMLAKKMDEDYKWTFPCLAEVKYDGERMIAIADGVGVQCFSRGGRVSKFSGVFDKELNQLAKNMGCDVAFDGEVLGKNFSETAQARGSKNTKLKGKLRYHVFDMMDADVWKKREHTLTQLRRSERVEKYVGALESDRVIPASGSIIRSLSEAHKFYEKAVASGFEGLIIKNLGGYYEWDRSKNWVKWKPVYTFDLTVKDIIGGKKGKKYEGTTGALRLVGKDENGRKINTKMGTGMSDKNRDFFWKNRKRLIGVTIEVEAQEMTQAKHKDTWALRFCSFVKIREDK